ncbi:MAG: hypothetical protein E6Q94_03325 [Burkholderiaceae bacterium]|nr:MAG: hypothetical protein E6Q94_03325 [Burkholderiaceae bacterium]
MSEPKIKYEIAADVTGQEDAQALTQNLQALGDVLDKELAHQARNAAQALQAIGDKRAALEQFSALKNEADALAVELAQAESGLQQVQQQLDAAATATQGYVRAEMHARAALAAKQQELASTRQELQQLNASTTGAARKTDEYRQAVDTARGTIQRLTAEIALEKTGLKQVQDQIKAATQEENALAAQRDKGAQALIQTRGALQDNAAALASAGTAAQRLGVDTANLSREEAALAAALRAQAPVLAAVNQEVVRLGQSQERTAQLSKEMQDAARKLGMEGIQAPKALEQAFLQLGMSGVKPAHKAIQELQIALAQIKASDVVDSQKQAAIAAFSQKVAELRGQAGAAAGATQQLGQAAQGAGDQLGSAARTAAAWASALVGLQQLKGIATAVVDTGAQFETLHVRLSNLLGSTEAANQAFGMLKQLAASTPFDVAGLTESFVKLTAFGMQPTEAQMRSLADVAANLGGGTEALQGVTLALGQAWAKSKLQGEEILQLAERGVPVWDALSRATGRTVPELQRMSEAGLLGRDVIAKLIDELGRLNEGASDKLMRTYAGAVANAKDALAEFFDMVAKAGVLDWLTDKVRDLLAEFERMKQTGELQQKAQQLADAFVTLANMADAAAQGVATLAPVIKVAVEAMIALKAVQLGSALLSIATGANAATVAVGAAGAAAGAAAPALGLAAAGARGLGLALRAIPGAALLVALGEGAAWLAGKLFGPKASAEQSSKAIDDMLKERPVNGPQVAAQNIVTAMTGVEKTTHDAVKAFDALIAKGEQVDAALSRIGKGFDLTTVPGIQGASAVLAQLLAESKITAEQFRDQWDKALKGIDLREFEALARHAFSGIDADSKQLQATIDAGLREAVRRTGLDFDLLANGVGRAAASSMHDLGMLIDNLDRLKEQGIDTGKVLSASLSKAIDTADSQKALDDVRVQIERVRSVLGEKVADGLLDQAKQKAEKLKEALDAATPGINSVAEAMKALGITSDESLRQTAKTAKEAYDTLAESGKASARELGEGFKKAAEAAIAANNGVAPAWVTASAAMRGFEVEVDKAGKSTLRLKDATDKAADAHGRAAKATREQTTELERLNAQKEREIAAQEKANQLKEREIELYNKHWNMDKQHRSLDADGKVREETGMPTSKKFVFDKAKTAGLSEEEALEFADAFDLSRLKDRGSWGTPFVNMKRLDDAIEEAVMASIRKKAQKTEATEATTPQSVRPAQTAEPVAGRGAGAVQPVGAAVTRVVNIQIGGGRSFAVPTNAAGESSLKDVAHEVLKQLAVASATYGGAR